MKKTHQGSFRARALLALLQMTILTTSTSHGALRASEEKPYPVGPSTELTPGSLCERPTRKRYPEAIPYCERAVGSELKREIMENYDRKYGFRITQMDRGAFKIDHFIPLCMGGSNREDNLWPQHESVYLQTDPLEGLACEKMARGKLRQKDAVAWIREAKLDLSRAPAVLARIQAL